MNNVTNKTVLIIIIYTDHNFTHSRITNSKIWTNLECCPQTEEKQDGAKDQEYYQRGEAEISINFINRYTN